jgi:hypothetical protein
VHLLEEFEKKTLTLMHLSPSGQDSHLNEVNAHLTQFEIANRKENFGTLFFAVLLAFSWYLYFYPIWFAQS